MDFRQNSGLTLVEILIAMVISSFVVLGVYQVFSMMNRHSMEIREANAMNEQLKLASLILKKGISPTGYGLTEARTNFDIDDDTLQVSFIDEFDRYGFSNKEIVMSFFVKNDTLFQQIVSNGTTVKKGILTPVDSLAFNYYQEDGTTTSTAADVLTIEYVLRMRSSKKGMDMTRETIGRITPLNFK